MSGVSNEVIADQLAEALDRCRKHILNQAGPYETTQEAMEGEDECPACGEEKDHLFDCPLYLADRAMEAAKR